MWRCGKYTNMSSDLVVSTIEGSLKTSTRSAYRDVSTICPSFKNCFRDFPQSGIYPGKVKRIFQLSFESHRKSLQKIPHLNFDIINGNKSGIHCFGIHFITVISIKAFKWREFFIVTILLELHYNCIAKNLTNTVSKWTSLGPECFCRGLQTLPSGHPFIVDGPAGVN